MQVIDKSQTDTPARRSVLTIDAKPHRKTFHLNDILSLYTGYLLCKEGAAAVHRLVGFIMEDQPAAATTSLYAETVRQCLKEQLPFLKDVRVDGLFAIVKADPRADNPYLRVWCDMQALKYGDEHWLYPQSRWVRRKNSHKL